LVQKLYGDLIESWNKQNSEKMAECFGTDGNMIGFDGSHVKGRKEIEMHLKEIFIHHKTASYVTIIRNIRFITNDVCILEAVVGMVPAGKNDINPAVNAVQTIVAQKQNNSWLIENFQNTPAAYHGRPELVEKLSNELRSSIR
jgi:uncharacterized protein (TIGR02246 family)